MRVALVGLAALICTYSTPAIAQQSAMKPGPMWNAARIDVLDGQTENYLDWLSKTWAANQAFAKTQGWLLDYHILESVNPRDGEPDIILITTFADYPSATESERRNDIINKRMQQDDHTADAASGQRGSMRKLMGSVLYRELKPR
ncbi:MAG TPA: hypothetical protein VNR68_00535 [Sphingomicrobium sp.]|nr:hypothetical protein [Sphingomicrobium sp.]